MANRAHKRRRIAGENYPLPLRLRLQLRLQLQLQLQLQLDSKPILRMA